MLTIIFSFVLQLYCILVPSVFHVGGILGIGFSPPITIGGAPGPFLIDGPAPAPFVPIDLYSTFEVFNGSGYANVILFAQLPSLDVSTPSLIGPVFDDVAFALQPNFVFVEADIPSPSHLDSTDIAPDVNELCTDMIVYSNTFELLVVDEPVLIHRFVMNNDSTCVT